MAKKTKAGKQHRKVKAKKHVARKHVAKKQVRRQRKPQVAPQASSAPVTEQQTQPQAEQSQASGAHLDAPSAVPHPGAGHQSVVRSEVQR